MSEHRTLTGDSLHEPKGVDSAVLGTVYHADGAGSGEYKPPQLQGQDVAESGELPVSDGSGGVAWTPILDAALARIDLVNSAVAVALTAGDLHTPASYTDVTSNYSQSYNVGGLTFDGTNHFVIPFEGIYRITAWVSLSSSSAGSPVFGMDINVNGVAAAPGSAVVQSAQKDVNNVVTLTGFGTGYFSGGDVVGLSFASTLNTTLTLYDSVVDLERIRG